MKGGLGAHMAGIHQQRISRQLRRSLVYRLLSDHPRYFRLFLIKHLLARVSTKPHAGYRQAYIHRTTSTHFLNFKSLSEEQAQVALLELTRLIFRLGLLNHRKHEFHIVDHLFALDP